MGQVVREARKGWRKLGLNLGPSDGPLYSFDNDSIHTAANLCCSKINDSLVVELPARSPDLHRVIEHVFGYVSNAFNQHLWYNPSCDSLAKYKAAIIRVFKEMVTPAAISADVKGLKALYDAVRKGGKWPKKSLR